MIEQGIKSLRLGVFCPRAHDATSLYRAMGPLAAMERQDDRLILCPPAMGPEGLDISWAWLSRIDVLFVQRPWRPEHVQLCVQAAMLRKPVWVDWDDDYPSVHPSNPAYHQFAGCDENLDRVCRIASLITVTTEEIAKRRSAKTGTRAKFQRIPNALHFPMAPLEKERSRRVCWRGGASHEYDLLQFLPALAETAQLPQFSRWDWVFLGDVPWQVGHVMPKDRLVMDFGAEPYLYMEAMSKLLPWVHIVPLAETPFNGAKSNITWIEATAAGAVTVAPNWPEWQQPGVIHYKNKHDLMPVLSNTMKAFAAHTCHPNVLNSRAYIEKNLTIDQVNEARWRILNRLYHHAQALRINPAATLAPETDAQPGAQ